ncbi:MAG: hypothetical protein ACI9U5_001241 [Colwellia sp.]
MFFNSLSERWELPKLNGYQVDTHFNWRINMTTKSIIFNTLFVSITLASPISTFASDLALKVAVIKDTIASKNIIAGDSATGIKRLTRINRAEPTFENNMSLCVAYIQSNNVKKSENACSAAIKSTKSMPLHNEKVTYLKSLSYSNRGVSRYFSDDLSGAIDDLTTAISINSNPITKSNLMLVTGLSVEPNESVASLLSD